MSILWWVNISHKMQTRSLFAFNFKSKFDEKFTYVLIILFLLQINFYLFRTFWLGSVIYKCMYIRSNSSYTQFQFPTDNVYLFFTRQKDSNQKNHWDFCNFQWNWVCCMKLYTFSIHSFSFKETYLVWVSFHFVYGLFWLTSSIL